MDKLKKDKEKILGKNKKKTKNTSIKNKENLHSKVENLQKELIQAKEENLRYLAEIDNLRKSTMSTKKQLLAQLRFDYTNKQLGKCKCMASTCR